MKKEKKNYLSISCMLILATEMILLKTCLTLKYRTKSDYRRTSARLNQSKNKVYDKIIRVN